ncbi:unnamed protein product [Cladocopium goreaui]|uniref:Ribosomal protein L37 n=1 Tax=Cladocopium goreaui TaxID=2562237 RepID=A0A9P1C5Q1_9DINO|nr:unnamed protein product [Cladocopium goreaui]
MPAAVAYGTNRTDPKGTPHPTMGDGTPAMGKRHKKTHALCPRCGKKQCAACGFPATKIRSYNWSKKSKRRRAPGTGRMSYVKHIGKRFKNGFREGGAPPARKKKPAEK